MYEKFFSAYKEQIQKFKNHLEVAEVLFSVESIHEMRVALKKTRALLKLFNFLFKERFSSESPGVYLRNIFKSAAELRDSHIMISLYYEYKKPEAPFSELQKYLKNLEKQGINNFKKILVLNKDSAYKKIADSFSCLENEKTTKKTDVDINIHINKKVNRIADLYESPINDIISHKLRIKLKELNFLLEVESDSLKHEIISELKIIASNLGGWHDKVILLNHLEILKSVKYSNQPNFSKYSILQNSLISENKNDLEKNLNVLKKRICILTDNYYQKTS